jgi:hypothetical protein
MALFLDANGQLVIADSMPSGGSVVANPPSQNLADLAAWFRALDDNGTQWHPANYYNGQGETLLAAGVVVKVSAVNRASVFTATDGILDTQSDLQLQASVTNLANPVFVWTQSGLENAPETSTTANYVVTAANFGSAKSAIVTCTINGIFSDSITIARLEKSTAQAGATYGATPEQALAIAAAISDSAQAVIDAQSVLTNIDDMFSDSKLTPVEKKRIKIDWEKIKQEKPKNLDKAQTYSLSTTAYVAAYDALFYYLNGDNNKVTTWADYQNSWQALDGSSWVNWISDDPRWLNTISTTTAIIGATFRAKFQTYYDEQAKLLKAISDEAGKNAQYEKLAGTPNSDIANATIIPDIEIAQAVAVSARNELDAIASDSIISHSEKRLIRKDWEIALSEHANTSALATGTTENTNYVAKFNALATYLNGGVTWTSGTPSWITDAILAATTSVDIEINGATFRAKFSEFYAAKLTLIKKANDIAATLSSWNGTSGKPSNIASLSGAEAILNSAVTYYNLPDKPQSRGVWNNSYYYYFGDIVMYNGNGYFCILPHWSNGSTYPSYATWYWAQISQKGATQATELSDYNNIANANVNWDYVRSLYSTYAKPADGATVNNGAFANLAGAIPAGSLTSYIQQGTISFTYLSSFANLTASYAQWNIVNLPSVPWSVTYLLTACGQIYTTNGNPSLRIGCAYGYGPTALNFFGGRSVTDFEASVTSMIAVTIPANTQAAVYLDITTGGGTWSKLTVSILGVKV